jgi:hypothetical protein
MKTPGSGHEDSRLRPSEDLLIAGAGGRKLVVDPARITDHCGMSSPSRA